MKVGQRYQARFLHLGQERTEDVVYVRWWQMGDEDGAYVLEGAGRTWIVPCSRLIEAVEI